MGSQKRAVRVGIRAFVWVLVGSAGMTALSLLGWSHGLLGSWTGQLAEGVIRIYGR